MKLLGFVLFSIFLVNSASANYWVGAEYGLNPSVQKDLKDQKASYLGVQVFKQFSYVDLGLSYGEYVYKNTFKVGPFYEGEATSQIASLQINPRYMFSQNFGLIMKNQVFLNEKLVTDVDKEHSGMTGVGFVFAKRFSDFQSRIDLTYNRGWNFNYENDLIMASLSFTLGKESFKVPVKKQSVTNNEKKQELENPSTLVLEVNFKFNSAEVSDVDEEMLHHMSKLIKVGKVFITIKGHSDISGPIEAREKVSLLRAENVKKILVNEGVDSSSIKVLGMGSLALKDTSKGKEANSKNRRSEIIILKEVE